MRISVMATERRSFDVPISLIVSAATTTNTVWGKVDREASCSHVQPLDRFEMRLGSRLRIPFTACDVEYLPVHTEKLRRILKCCGVY